MNNLKVKCIECHRVLQPLEVGSGNQNIGHVCKSVKCKRFYMTVNIFKAKRPKAKYESIFVQEQLV